MRLLRGVGDLMLWWQPTVAPLPPCHRQVGHDCIPRGNYPWCQSMFSTPVVTVTAAAFGVNLDHAKEWLHLFCAQQSAILHCMHR